MTDFATKVYIYNEEYIQRIYDKIEALRSSGTPLTVEEFNKFDQFHPAGNTGIDIFLSEFPLPKNSLILDIGCGIGGTCRHLASHEFRTYGVDILPFFVDCAVKMTDLANLSHMCEFHVADISNQLPSNKFDTALLVGVLLVIPGTSIFHNIYQSLKASTFLYLEDYCFLRPEFSEEEKSLIEEFYIPGTRTKEDLRSGLEGAGFEVVCMDDFSKEWSEFAWTRAESFWQRKNSHQSISDAEIRTYGVNSPKLLSHIDHIPMEDIQKRFPLALSALGSAVIFTENKPVGVVRVVARKN